MVQNLTACLMYFLRSTSIMRTPMPLGKGELMRITTGSFVDGYLRELRKRLPKKSHSSKIGLITILKNAWTTNHPENLFFMANLNLKFGILLLIKWKPRYLSSTLGKTRRLEDFISSVHCKEGRSHQDIDEQEGSYSWHPRVEEVKTVTKEGRPKGC